MIYNPQYETLSREAMRELQGERLHATVKHNYENVPFYKAKFEEKGLTPDDIRSVDDLSKLPFTLKSDLRDTYPFGLFAVPKKEIVRVHASSGTTGKSTVVGYTAEDIDVWSDTTARTLAGAGGCEEDIIQVAYGYGLFTGGLGMHYGAEKLGALTVPISGGNTQRQLMLLEDLQTTMIACTPSYALLLAEIGESMGVDFSKLPLRAGVFGAEPSTEAMREEIEKRLRIKAFDIYGLSEIIGPGVSFECEAQAGLHINEDHFIPEIIDPETGEVLPEGSVGELVFTCVTKKALPLIRYRTRDITALHYEKCACGRTTVRMEKVKGRSDDMLIIRGVNVFPSQIETVLLSIEETEPHYQLIVRRDGPLDKLEIQFEVNERIFSDEVKRLMEIEKKVAHAIASVIGINAKIKLVEPKTIQRSEGKAKRVIDLR